jgi:hypothetical protein
MTVAATHPGRRVGAAIAVVLLVALWVLVDAGTAGAVSPGTPAGANAGWSVLVVDTATGLFRCSGEVVDRHHVLTARHCLAPQDSYRITFADGRSLTTAVTAAMPGDVRCGAADSTPTCHYETDLRVLTFSEDLAGFTSDPIPLVPQDPRHALDASPVSFVGWGGAVAPAETAEGEYHLGCGVMPRGLCYGFTGLTTVVIGDSGGAWTATDHGSPVLLGTETDGVDGQYEFGPSVYAQRAWLAQHLDARPAASGDVVSDDSGGVWLVFPDGFRRRVNGTGPSCPGLPQTAAGPRRLDAFDLAIIPAALDEPATCPPAPANANPTSSGARVVVARGRSAAGRPGCASAACSYLVVSSTGLPPGPHVVRCRGAGGTWATYTTRRSTSAVCYFGHPGRLVWASVDGVRSRNSVRW